MVASGGTTAPDSSAGTLTINGNYTQDADGVLAIETGGTAPGSQFHLLDVTGTAMLHGLLEVSLNNESTPEVDDELTVLTAGNETD